MAREAPLLTPTISGVASRLRTSVCTRQPESPMAAPATMTPRMRGSRILNRVSCSSRVPSPSRVLTTPAKPSLPPPTLKASRASASSAMANRTSRRQLGR